MCVPYTVNELVTDIILNITSQEDLMLTLLHIGSRLFELFSKEVRVKKQPGTPLNNRRTGKHATKPRPLGLLGHSVINCIPIFANLR